VNPQWSTLTCPQEAATTAWRLDGPATAVWSNQHNGKGWQDPARRSPPVNKAGGCGRDEYPPAYLMNSKDPAYINSGKNAQGQLVRWVSGPENSGAGSMWTSVCITGALVSWDEAKFSQRFVRDTRTSVARTKQKAHLEVTDILGGTTSDQRPEFSIGDWDGLPAGDGMTQNACWPKGIASKDPGFALLLYDPYYGGKAPPYDYSKPYVQGSNGD
jgi:hypothetical protein